MLTEAGAIAGFGTLAIQLFLLWRERPRLRVFARLCRADGSYLRGCAGLTHVRFEVLNDGGKQIVLRGSAGETKTRVPPGPFESGSMGDWHMQGEEIVLAPGRTWRATMPLGRPAVRLWHEVRALWAEDTLGRRYRVPARRVNSIE